MPLWTRIERLGARIVLVGVIAVGVALIAIIFLGGQTSRILSAVGSSIGTPPGGGSVQAPGSETPSAASGGSAGSGGRVAIVDVARPDLLVIRTGTLDLQVADVPRAVDAATREVEAVGGYLSSSEQVGEGPDVTASATFRIPVDSWAATLSAVRAMAIKVVAVQVSTDDVSAQVVDLRARIANLEVTERALQAIMDQATKIEDVLKVQKELTTVCGAIEEAVARKQDFEDQAAFSTLTVRFGLKPVAAVVATQEGFDPAAEVDGATARLVGILQQGATAAIWFGIVWLPFLVVFAIGALAVAALVRSRSIADPTRDVTV